MAIIEDETSISQPLCKNCRWWEYESICDFPFTIQGDDAYQNGNGAECVNFTPKLVAN